MHLIRECILPLISGEKNQLCFTTFLPSLMGTYSLGTCWDIYNQSTEFPRMPDVLQSVQTCFAGCHTQELCKLKHYIFNRASSLFFHFGTAGTQNKSGIMIILLAKYLLECKWTCLLQVLNHYKSFSCLNLFCIKMFRINIPDFHLINSKMLFLLKTTHINPSSHHD